MRRNRVKAALAAGDVALGTSVFEFDTPGFPRIAAGAGIDFILFDTEHNGWTSETLRPLLSMCRAVDLVPMVRVDSLDQRRIDTVLDLGAMGIMVPTLETADEARRFVEHARYPPAGRRGSAFGLAHDDFVANDGVASSASANRETLLIALIETALGVENIDSIAQTDGIDVLWIGQVDLTFSLGILSQYSHPDYIAALDRVVEAAHRHGKALGFTVTSVDEGKRLIDRGFTCISYWNDVRIYQQALRLATNGLRQAGDVKARQRVPPPRSLNDGR